MALRDETGGAGDLRIGDRERDEVTRILHDAFAQGRITRDELDERLEATLSARTAGDLRRVTADLPEAWTGGSPAAHPRTPYGHPPGGGPGFSGMGLPGFPGARPGPHGPRPAWGPAAWAGPPWAGHEGHRHGLASWGPHPAARMAMGRARGGPPLIAIAALGILVAALVTGAVWPLFIVVKVLFVVLLVKAVLGMAHHRRHHRGRGYDRHRRRR